MSAISTLCTTILEHVNRGQTPADIAHALDVPVSWVYEAMELAEAYSQYVTINS